ncbi:MAG TPA: GvpL/GvpF family gas vesicle protein [Gemmatimonadales bacterium]|nr:GvpL/GvpF family gas vesicle protein [Gemmatimonadales bacterium]
MLYVYGVVDSPSFDGTSVKGHDGASVFAVPCGDCAAAASSLSRRMIAPSPRSVWLHQQVLDVLMQRHAVLPLRFATIVPDEGVLRDRLRSIHRALADDLRRLRGKVEFALRVTNIHAECPHARDAERKDDATQALPPGTRYLRERIASEDTARRIERALRRHLDPAAEHAVWALATTRAPTLTASYLVERNEVSSFVATVIDVRARHPALDVSCTGPWAPYSFVTVRAPEAW